MFPNAAAANRSIFYDRSGSARSVSEVYSVLIARYAGAAGSCRRPATALALYGDTPADDRGRECRASGHGRTAVPSIDASAYLSTFPDTRAPRRRSRSASASAPASTTPPTDPIFRSLFQVDEHVAAGLADGARIMGQVVVADVGGGTRRRADQAATARSVQRSQRHFAARAPRARPAVDRLQRAATGTRQSAAHQPMRLKLNERRRALNKTSIKPAVYGERFVKRRGLFCLAVTRFKTPLVSSVA